MSVQFGNVWKVFLSRPEVGTCGSTILLVIVLALQLFLSGCADPCAASSLAILSAIAQAQFKYDYERLFFNQM